MQNYTNLLTVSIMSNYVLAGKKQLPQAKKSIFKKILLIVCIVAVLSVCATLYFYWQSMMPVVIDIASAKVNAEATRLLNQAICAAISDAEYADFMNVERNSQGEVTMISANSVYVNTLARISAITAQNKMDTLENYRVDIPIGTLSGIVLLTNKGPSVSIEVSPIGGVSCEFVSKFESAGVNQTLHRIYANVNADVALILPAYTKTTKTHAPILISETLIIGNIPQTYLNGFTMGSYKT